MKPSVLIPVAPGTNRDGEMAVAFAAAGAETAQVPLQAIRDGEVKLGDHQILAIPGGFSYGDALGAGRLLGLDLAGWFGEQLSEAMARQMPIIGICNGFQALVSTGILPGDSTTAASLVVNENGRFECRWVELEPASKLCVWTAELSAPLRCPVAHGEGRFVASDVAAIDQADQVAFHYSGSAYPDNPNGSMADIAGVCDASGLVLGLMPHPEDHVSSRQDPLRGRPGGDFGLCLPLFEAGVKAVAGYSNAG